jgi:hypothetical protein
MCTHMHTHAHMNAHAHTSTHMHAPAHTCTHTHMNAHTTTAPQLAGGVALLGPLRGLNNPIVSVKHILQHQRKVQRNHNFTVKARSGQQARKQERHSRASRSGCKSPCVFPDNEGTKRRAMYTTEIGQNRPRGVGANLPVCFPTTRELNAGLFTPQSKSHDVFPDNKRQRQEVNRLRIERLRSCSSIAAAK